ncbi:bifunctional [glutamine synthetase] adenylyltransferase/[glutamine synthetase]-adenylyl-L-tyrosine phosphorylase [Rhodococcus rhodnii]|uniref:Bifunctional glutamine synthetase adenylyltransferase/adenylyl-removing enzyme n=2 Tax=Rhodococcus rhodnii TaxID=38312 RepID=R7WL69_9NOCA|nr:bifunctional [glutamine synthetase] adenylyltransferase/[glutamine synthetase]-adenylyl-L-tyrosine phosphorylase [Rhodococcus rhodnii]EOM76047.1 glutamate--ammonia-ligase adenylyltransferase [Rhodococcus rhodnii LMG 5362]TXG91453.1 bifunctional [glutamine synthetase] adenylyltransferase/[glutamine synthetase]-adenylyl-L-tyrosine phosphorylase [Rhodococcus rhodnii]
MVRPPTSRSIVPGTGRLGLVEPTAAEDLRTLGWTGVDDIPLLWALSRAPDADLALRALMRIREALGDGWQRIDTALRTDLGLRGRLFGLLGSSTALGDHLVAHPTRVDLLAGGADLPSRDALDEVFLAAVDAHPEPGRDDDAVVYRAGVTGGDAVAALRDAYRDQLALLAAIDLAPTVEDEPVLPYNAVAEHLSDMADAALTAALAVAIATVCGDKPCGTRLAVIAMGKCGARELNYVSDVDVVFVAEPADATASRIAGELMRVGSSAFFDVDAALRPEGKSGELVRTLDSHIAYYRRWAKTWEFQALLKARPMTGDMALGRDYVDALGPMVWTASEREDFVPEVQAMRRRVEEMVPPELRERELKLGRGSLRDVEFAVQLLQLVHGRADESLRVRSTVDALTALAAGGYVGRDDAANLTASYEFLRLLEHRLQLQRLKRTHTLPPDDDEALRWLARAAHMRPDGTHDSLGVLREEIRRNAHRVRRLHVRLFYRPLLDSVARMDRDAIVPSPEAAVRQLAALGYAAPENALGHLTALTAGASRKGRIQALLLPSLLETLADTPDPDAGLLAYRRLAEAMHDHEWFLRLLRDGPAVAERLMRILGSSAYLATLLLKAPDVIRLYVDSPTGPRLLEQRPADVAKGIATAAARYEDPARAIGAARALRRAELARVASADILGMLDVPAVCHALSSVWVAVLEASLGAVVRASERERGEPAPASLTVIGMGRLGGFELGYGSDADVMFVCEPRDGVDDTTAVKWASTIADRVRTLLGTPSTDPPLEVDTGLRPEGRNGPVVRTLASYRAYYEQWAQSWEVQALLRATSVAGDADLGLRFLHMIDRIRYPEGGVSENAVREIRRIKARVDSERLPRGADPATHTKLGRGGLADVEWTVQLLQLRHAHAVPALHNTSTLETLDVLEQTELLDAENVELLRESWTLATKARNALVLVRGKPTDQLPSSGRVLAGVACIAGWGAVSDVGEFLDHYMRVTRRARGVVEDVFGD